ncbi:MAG: sensor histidine kinase [Flavobacteriaceae bacterium]|nr:MAG: sensor histidine kinase [Flavobacteriaceae bacterium]
MNKKYNPLIHLLFWILLIGGVTSYILIDGKPIRTLLYIRILIGVLFFYINYSVLVPMFLFKKKKVRYFISVVLLLIASFYAFSMLQPDGIPDFKNAGISLDTIPRNHRGGPEGRPRFIIVLFTLVSIVLGSITRLYQKLVEDENLRKQIESQKNKTELESLKNQLNPHFLFNSLNSIYSLSVKKSDDTPEAIIMLSELMRYMLYKANNAHVLLKDELEYIENYIRLHRLRIVNNEQVKISIRGDITSQRISPLLFISYIENAFKYGTDFSGNTEVTIGIIVTKNELQFNCINLIGSRVKKDGDSGIGMKNTLERLKLLYPNKHRLELKEENNKFMVKLTLQLD